VAQHIVWSHTDLASIHPLEGVETLNCGVHLRVDVDDYWTFASQLKGDRGEVPGSVLEDGRGVLPAAREEEVGPTLL